MKTRQLPLALLILTLSVMLATGCTSAPRKEPAASKTAAAHGNKSDGKSLKGHGDELDEYQTATVADPLEPLNRVTFWLNDEIYTLLFRPISKGYQAVVPKVVRTGIYNAFDNVQYPVRVVNDALQANFPRAGKETQKFLVNTVVGVGGIGKPSNHIPALADVPAGDTGQTFAKWGIGHGIYIVLPVFGPSSIRDTVGLAGDYALNPVNWVSIIYGGYAWTIAIPSTNSLRNVPVEMDQYDSATKNSLDRYLAARSAYVQYRSQVAKK